VLRIFNSRMRIFNSRMSCRQYHYVLQSLMLWREVSNDMFKLWYLAEADMLRQGTSYRLCDTGQGLNRVQVRGWAPHGIPLSSAVAGAAHLQTR
jgi:hypothetical protein